jgi:hypothetical protein
LNEIRASDDSPGCDVDGGDAADHIIMFAERSGQRIVGETMRVSFSQMLNPYHFAGFEVDCGFEYNRARFQLREREAGG